MGQVKDGRVRVVNGSAQVKGSWTAVQDTGQPGDPENFQADEVVNFAPSGAAGRFMELTSDDVTVRFIVTSGTPAAGDTMTGATSAEVITILKPAVETRFLDRVQPALDDGSTPEFTVSGSGIARLVQAVVAQDELTLEASWLGATATAQVYAVTIDFEAGRNLALISRGDIEHPTFWNRNARKAGADLASLLGTFAKPAPNFDGVILNRTAALTNVASGTVTAVPWDNVIEDSRSSNPGVTPGWWDPASPTQVSIPLDVSHLYVAFGASWAANATGEREAAVNTVSGVMLGGIEPHDRGPAAAAGATILGDSTPMVGQTTITQLFLNVLQTSGSPLNLNGGGFQSTYLVVVALRRQLALAAETLVAAPPATVALTPNAPVWENTGAPFGNAGFDNYLGWIRPTGVVRVATGQTAASGSVIATFPAGSRPPADLPLWSGTTRVDILAASGDMIYNGATTLPAGFWISLSALPPFKAA